MLKIYLAGRYSQKEEIKEFAEKLMAIPNVFVTSRWLEEKWPPNTTMDRLPLAELQKTALQDYEDVKAADAVIFFACPPDLPTVRGGRHVEFGFALAMAKLMWVVGPKENIFHHMPWVEHCRTKAGMLAKVKSQARYFK